MTSIGSWRFWVIVALALGTLACAGKAERRERREEAREERRERAEARRSERQERTSQRRAPRDGRTDDEPKSAPAASPAPSTNKQTTSTLTPVSTAPTAAVAESTMVFMRPGALGGAIAATVFDVTGPDTKIIGIINMRGKLTYPMKPGQYTFMVVSEAADFLQVTVLPGKTYYALVSPRMGAWKARFSFTPLRGSDSRAEQWERSTNLQNNPARAESWMRSNQSSVEDKRSRWWPVWDGKPEAQKASQTLLAEDGR
jgi:hypothetical protein